MRRIELKVDLGIIEKNARKISDHIASGVKILSVVKADAYGHGSVQVARRLEEKNLTDCFAVATVDEGIRLREAGIKSEILVLGYFSSDETEDAIENELSFTVYSEESLFFLNKSAREAKKTANAHLKIETGMNRIGIKPGEELDSLLGSWKEIQSVKMKGIFSHFSSADSDPVYTENQFSVFQKACEKAQERGFYPVRHIAASSAMFDEKYQLDMVRAGIALYGSGGMKDELKLVPAQTLISHPVRIMTVPKGTKIGYSMNFTSERETVVMTVPCGYGDGYPRSLSNRASVLVNGKRAPVIGNVCMDMLMADITDCGNVDQDTQVVLLGSQGNECITPDELADLANTIPYEIMLGFSSRVTRTWTH